MNSISLFSPRIYNRDSPELSTWHVSRPNSQQANQLGNTARGIQVGLLGHGSPDTQEAEKHRPTITIMWGADGGG